MLIEINSTKIQQIMYLKNFYFSYPARAADTKMMDRALRAMAKRHRGFFFIPVSCLFSDLCQL